MDRFVRNFQGRRHLQNERNILIVSTPAVEGATGVILLGPYLLTCDKNGADFSKRSSSALFILLQTLQFSHFIVVIDICIPDIRITEAAL